jgi:hypothetical protein
MFDRHISPISHHKAIGACAVPTLQVTAIEDTDFGYLQAMLEAAIVVAKLAPNVNLGSHICVCGEWSGMAKDSHGQV